MTCMYVRLHNYFCYGNELKKKTQNMNLKNKYCNKKSVYFFLTNTQKHSIIARERIIKSNQAGKKSEYKFLVTMKAK